MAPTLYDAAEKAQVDLYFEASVAGAIPLLRPLRESLAGDRVTRLIGIVNGTTNYVLSRMDEAGLDFDTAVREAQELGYAEADPTADIDGSGRSGEGGDSRQPRVPHPGHGRRRPPRGDRATSRRRTSRAPTRWATS